jgi:hypothetical protein
LEAAIDSLVSSIETTLQPDYRRHHSILYCHECAQCQHFYKSTKVLTKHKLAAHSLQPVFACANTSECELKFAGIQEFLAHARLHPQKNIVCSRCHVKFGNKNLLRHHMKSVHYNRSRPQLSGTTELPAVRPQTQENIGGVAVKVSKLSKHIHVTLDSVSAGNIGTK